MSDSSPAIKRAPRTYGRPRAPLADTSLDADTSFGNPGLLSDTSGQFGSSETGDVPPTSDFDASYGSTHDDEDDNDASLDGDILPANLKGYVSIRDALHMIDQEMDETEEINLKESSSVRLEANKEPLRSLSIERTDERVATSPPNIAAHPSTLLSISKASHTPPYTHAPSPANSPSPSPLIPRVRKKRVVTESDSESELARQSPSPQTSPSALFHINTPAGRSSPTPPTSTEMAPHKGKGKEALKPIPGLDIGQMHDSSDDEKPARKRPRSKGKGEEPRTKAPTKKDVLESKKATARLQAQRTVAVPRVQQKQLHLSDLLQRVGKAVKHEPHPPSSDPIVPFSPAPPESGPSRPTPVVQFSRHSGPRALTPQQEPCEEHTSGLSFELPELSDDEELPDASELLWRRAQEDEAAKRKQELRELKLRALERQQREAVTLDPHDSSDLEIEETMGAVVKEEAQERRRSKALNVKTPVRKRKSQLPSGLHLEQQQVVLTAAARPSFVRDTRFEKGKDGQTSRIRKDDLNRMLLQNIDKERSEIIERKEREWTSKGGKIMSRQSADERGEEVMKVKMAELAAKGLSRVQQEEADDDDMEGSEDDDDWKPQEGEPNEQDTDQSEHEPFVVHQSPESNEDEAEEVLHAPVPKLKRRPTKVVDSDGEEERPTGRILVPNSSLVLDSPPRLESSDKENANDTEIENETDKENDASLMFDRGEDKENTVIASSEPPIPRPLFDRKLSSPFSSEGDPFPSLDIGLSPALRTPLKMISHSDDDDDPFGSTENRVQDLRHVRSPDFFSPSRRMPDNSPEEAESSTQGNKACSLEPPAKIKVGFSQFMATQKEASGFSPMAPPASKSQFSQFVTPAKAAKGFEALRRGAKGNDLSLTLGLPIIQPSLDVTDSARKKADEIFDKEQQFMVEEAIRPPDGEPQLYLNEHGFYTQNPVVNNGDSSPFVLDLPSSQNTFAHSSPLLNSVLKSKHRAPLGTIDLADDLDEPQASRLGRLKRRTRTPDLDETFNESGYRSSPSPSPKRPKDAFNVLMQRRPKLPKNKLEKSAFIEGEAEESDEDAMFGFGGPKLKADDDEEDGEDQDATLEELMDDKAMDADTLNEDKVLEKVKEHQELDDAELERIHREAVEGKLRAKRRDRGVGFEDSDSDDENDENARRRKRMAKKRRLDGGDSLDQLAKDKETQAFVASYNAGLPDDDLQDFAHLQYDDGSVTLPVDTRDEDEGSDDEENHQPDIVSTRDLQAELRQAARGEMSHNTVDPEDLSWLENDQDMDVEEEPIRIKEVAHTNRQSSAKQSNNDQFDYASDVRFTKPSGGLTQHTKWASKARAEGLNGTGRASAITGHAVPKSKAGGSILGRHSGPSNSRTGKQPAKVTKSSSALSVVSSRRERFGS